MCGTSTSAMIRNLSIYLLAEKSALIMCLTNCSLSTKITSSNSKTIKFGESICKTASKCRLRSALISPSRRKMAVTQSRWSVESGLPSIRRPCWSSLITESVLSLILGIISRNRIWRTHLPVIYLNWVSFQQVQKKLLTLSATRLWLVTFKMTIRIARGPVSLWRISRPLASLGSRLSTTMLKLPSL